MPVLHRRRSREQKRATESCERPSRCSREKSTGPQLSASSPVHFLIRPKLSITNVLSTRQPRTSLHHTTSTRLASSPKRAQAHRRPRLLKMASVHGNAGPPPDLSARFKLKVRVLPPSHQCLPADLVIPRRPSTRSCNGNTTERSRCGPSPSPRALPTAHPRLRSRCGRISRSRRPRRNQKSRDCRTRSSAPRNLPCSVARADPAAACEASCWTRSTRQTTSTSCL